MSSRDRKGDRGGARGGLRQGGDRVGDEVDVGEAIEREVGPGGDRSRHAPQHAAEQAHRPHGYDHVAGERHRHPAGQVVVARARERPDRGAPVLEAHPHLRPAVGSADELGPVGERADDGESDAHALI